MLIDALEEEFPKLGQGGGFEILRCEGKSLWVIPPPPGETKMCVHKFAGKIVTQKKRKTEPKTSSFKVPACVKKKKNEGQTLTHAALRMSKNRRECL